MMSMIRWKFLIVRLQRYYCSVISENFQNQSRAAPLCSTLDLFRQMDNSDSVFVFSFNSNVFQTIDLMTGSNDVTLSTKKVQENLLSVHVVS